MQANLSDDEEGDVWLKVERLVETIVPVPGSAILHPWIETSKSTSKEPTLLSFVSAGLVYSEDELRKLGIDG